MDQDSKSFRYRGVRNAAKLGTLMSLGLSPILALLVMSYIDQSNGEPSMRGLVDLFGYVPDYQNSRDLLLTIVGTSALTIISKICVYIVDFWL